MKQNWEIKKLPDVVWFQEGPGVRKHQYTTSGVKLLNVANLVNGKVDLSTSDRYVSEEEAYGKYKHFLADEGDLILASSGIQVEYIEKKMGFIHKEHLPLCMNTSTIRFKPVDKECLNIRYFMYFLKSYNFKAQLYRLITGIAQLNFGPLHLKQMNIPVPPREEQERIVAELDCLSGIIERKREQLKELDALAQSIFYQMFGDPITNEKGWEVSTIENVCSSIVRGPFGSALKKEYFVEQSNTTYKVYEQKHAIQKDSSIGTYYISADMFETLSRFEIKEGDIIMSCSGTIGEFYEIPIGAEKGIMNQALLKYTLNKNIHKIYFLYVMEWVKENFEKKGSGLQNIGSVKTIKSTDISLPPLHLQQEFADKIEVIEKQKELIKQSITQTEELFNSRMDYYFN